MYFKTNYLNLVKAFSNTLPDLPTFWRTMSMKPRLEQEDFSYKGKIVAFSPQHWLPKHEKDFSVFTTCLNLHLLAVNAININLLFLLISTLRFLCSTGEPCLPRMLIRIKSSCSFLKRKRYQTFKINVFVGYNEQD